MTGLDVQHQSGYLAWPLNNYAGKRERNSNLSLDYSSSVWITKTFTNQLQPSWVPKAEGNSVNDLHRRRIYRCAANLHRGESWTAQCSQKGPDWEVSKAWFAMESLLPRSLAFLFPHLPPVHAVFSAAHLATALVAQFEVSWNPNIF